MIIEINDKGFLDREIVIKLPKEELNFAKDKKIIDFSRSLNLKGFRKGFIPRNIILSRFEKQIDSDVLNDLLYQSLVDFIKKNNINFVKFPFLKSHDYTSFEDYLVFIFELEIYPFFDINFDKIKIVKYKSFIDESDIDIEIDRLRNFYGTWKPVESVVMGDKVTFEIFDNSKVSVFLATDVIINNESTSLIGLLDFILGKKLGLNYCVFFSNNFITELLDKDKNFIFKIIDIKRFYMSDVDSFFYNSIGFDGTYDFRSFIKTNLNSIKIDIVNALLKQDMLMSLVSNHDFFVPNLILNDKLSKFKNEGINKEKKDAVNEIKLDLILKELIKKFNIYVSKDEVFKMLNDTYKSKTNLDETFYNYIENELYIEKIKDVLCSKVYIEEIEVKFSELLIMGNKL
ncbi:MAG TPA: trigger factor [Candidatus Azoamicus sp. MARI]